MPTIDLGNVRGPQGPQGETGPQGPQGIQGPAGPAGGVNSVNGGTGDVTIGGRNLALDTAEEKVSTSKDAATMGVHWELSDYGKSVLNTVGTPVVLSYEAKADVEGQRVSVNLRVGTSSAAKHVTPYNQFVYLTTEYKRYTFSCQTLLEDPGRAWVLLGAAPDGQVGNVYVRNLYVGTGTVAPDWAPAPEDLLTLMARVAALEARAGISTPGIDEPEMEMAATFTDTATEGRCE